MQSTFLFKSNIVIFRLRGGCLRSYSKFPGEIVCFANGLAEHGELQESY
ncbi:hypothetical protein X736_23325 [Mesorhizobium sp. L2C089B000]|nr:hypothetical protein X736_23325 [Mesorhizobium sp. L2C089B000]